MYRATQLNMTAAQSSISSAQDRLHRPLLALALLAPAPSIGTYFAMSFEATRGTTLGQIIYAASKVWILAFPLVWYILVERGRPSLSPARKGGLAIGAALGLGISVAIAAVYWLAARPWIDPEQMRDAATRNGLNSPQKYLALAAYLVLINSLLEEYVWRWFVYRQCERLLSGALAVAASAFLFTVHHAIALQSQMNWSVTLLACLGIFIGGCAWSWCYQRYRSIWPGYISHAIVDIAVLAIGYHIIFGA